MTKPRRHITTIVERKWEFWRSKVHLQKWTLNQVALGPCFSCHPIWILLTRSPAESFRIRGSRTCEEKIPQKCVVVNTTQWRRLSVLVWTLLDTPLYIRSNHIRPNTVPYVPSKYYYCRSSLTYWKRIFPPWRACTGLITRRQHGKYVAHGYLREQ